MSQKNKISINTAVCDLTEVTEELLKEYEEISINAATVIYTQRTKRLTARYSMGVNAASVIVIPDDSEVVLKMGSYTLSAKDFRPIEGKRYALVVNGKFMLENGTENLWKQFSNICVNGIFYYPESMEAEAARVQVNGNGMAYPDNAVFMEGDREVDRLFSLQAREDIPLIITGNVLIQKDDGCVERLLEKKSRIMCKSAYIVENLMEKALPLFDSKTKLTILPEGCRMAKEDMGLSPAVLHKLGRKLYIEGDLYVNEKNINILEELEYCRVKDTVYLPEDLKERFLNSCALYEELVILKGTLIKDKTRMIVNKDLLEQNPEGLHLVDCVSVEIEEDVPVKLIQERLKLENCVEVSCYPSQRSSVEMVSQDVVEIKTDTEDSRKEEEQDTCYINTASYKM